MDRYTYIAGYISGSLAIIAILLINRLDTIMYYKSILAFFVLLGLYTAGRAMGKILPIFMGNR